MLPLASYSSSGCARSSALTSSVVRCSAPARCSGETGCPWASSRTTCRHRAVFLLGPSNASTTAFATASSCTLCIICSSLVLLTALPALLLRLFGETGLSHPVSDQGGLLNRKQDRFWMVGQKGRGGLFRLEKEGLRAKGLSHTLPALGWQDQRHDTSSRRQVFYHSIWGGHKGDRVPGLRTTRLDLG